MNVLFVTNTSYTKFGSLQFVLGKFKITHGFVNTQSFVIKITFFNNKIFSFESDTQGWWHEGQRHSFTKSGIQKPIYDFVGLDFLCLKFWRTKKKFFTMIRKVFETILLFYMVMIWDFQWSRKLFYHNSFFFPSFQQMKFWFWMNLLEFEI